ncbi:MAG: glutamate-5-semialdehyde dehydrogenase [Paludibacteraceae bacterium]|nr:glutamate-5-semialdehyde dehydrogenase [Paludibacteraceae bacterium]
MNWKEQALEASRKLNLVSGNVINSVLLDVADAAESHTAELLEANQKDLDKMDRNNPLYDRLQLTEKRISDIAADMRKVATLESPLDKVIEERTLPNGLHLTKRSVPFGVIGIIYEARPNVSFDVFSLCLKSGNVCVLKGGTDAYNSNFAIVSLIKGVLKKHNLDENTVHLMPAGREATAELMDAVGYVDLIIPRGGAGLIKFVRENAKVPVIETGAGVVHAYFDADADLQKGTAIIANAKTRRVSVCNALDTLIINTKRLQDLPAICKPLAEKNVVIEADSKSFTFLAGKYPDNLLEKATDGTFGKEFMDYRMGLKTVDSLDGALKHIAQFSSKHSECIMTENAEVAARFQKEVDAACVYVNAPTSFTDGAQFGMGAEIGISTQKLHARGPMALPELTTYKWLINGNGQIRG